MPAEGITTNDSKVTAAGINAEAVAEGVTTYDPTVTTAGAKANEPAPGGRADRP